MGGLMRCPYCGAKGALVHGEELIAGSDIHDAICCRCPSCTVYCPIHFGPHPEMSPQKKEEFEKYRQLIDNESDFDFIPPIFNNGRPKV